MKFFVCVDGHNSGGKTTAVKNMVEKAKRKLGIPVYSFKFPTEYPVADMSPEQQVEHYLSDFETHLPELVDTKDRDALFVFDRSFLTTATYQGFDHDGDTVVANEHLQDILKRGFDTFSAYADSITFVRMSCPAFTAVKRMRQRGGKGTTRDVFEDILEAAKSAPGSASVEETELAHRIKRIGIAAERSVEELVKMVSVKPWSPLTVRKDRIDTGVLTPEGTASMLFMVACEAIATEYGA